MNNEYELNSIRDYKFEISEDSVNYNKLSESSTENSTYQDSNLVFSKLNPGIIEESKHEHSERSEDYRMSEENRISDRNLFSKIVFKTEEPTEEYASDDYSIVKCDKIITVRINDESFSYLNNPFNDNNFYYLKIQNDKFKLCEEKEYTNIYYNDLRVPYRNMKELASGLNNIVDKVYQEYNSSQYKKYFRFKFLKIIIMIMLLILSVAGYFYYIKFIQNDSKLISYSIYIIGFIFICILLFFLHSVYTNREIEFTKYKMLIMKQAEIEEYISSWNKRNGNKTIIVPIAYQYIQFSYNNTRVYIENHDIYY
jgi:hypothetical protein